MTYQYYLWRWYNSIASNSDLGSGFGLTTSEVTSLSSRYFLVVGPMDATRRWQPGRRLLSPKY